MSTRQFVRQTAVSKPAHTPSTSRLLNAEQNFENDIAKIFTTVRQPYCKENGCRLMKSRLTHLSMKKRQIGNSKMIHICQSAYARDSKICIKLISVNMVQGKYQYFYLIIFCL